uniref:EamA domain-containing protein n=1 Tax=Octactis speculum TaxID=3111310 RepID=A0A7S2CTM5_9STRA|mmetsp:Transcript_39866/g.54301  ORF Transcript_39866/g.54301 Transcript_39866/m.54301 type:complete len:143 (+) Transcript_39866:153-581(+)
MSDTVYEAASLVLVGMLWGCTNPFLKHGTAENDTKTLSENGTASMDGMHSEPTSADGIKNLWTLLRWKALIPYVINQLGSVVYYILLGSADISMAVPICNSLTFVFTAITGWLLGERLGSPMCAVFGITCVLVGVTICVLDS